MIDPHIRIIKYHSDHYEELVLSQLNDLHSDHFSDHSYIYWIDVVGLHQVGAIQQLGNIFNIDSFIVTDIQQTDQRPKFQDYDHYIYVVTKDLIYKEPQERIDTEQLSFLMGANFIISIQEWEGDVFEAVRIRLKSSKKPERKYGCAYLFYALLDAIVDNYFAIVEEVNEEIERIEDILLDPTNQTEVMLDIHHLRKQSLVLKHTMFPMREVIAKLDRENYTQYSDATRWLLRDIYEHLIELIESVDNCRDAVNDLVDLQMSAVSNKLNNVMKVLTVISTIFIPLTFVAGVYGMNFDNMPELHWHYGYYAVLLFMFAIAIALFAYFRRKSWI